MRTKTAPLARAIARGLALVATAWVPLAGCVGAIHVRLEVDRRLAIALALREAGPADVVLLAGKGHEDYQEIHGTKHPFSDVDEARQALAARSAP